MTKKAVACLLFLFTCCSMLWSQGTSSRIAGVTLDTSGAAVGNVLVTATNEGTHATYTTHSSAAGSYAFDSLQIGAYTIRAEAPGFKTFTSTGNVLSIGLPTTVAVTLGVGSAEQSVVVKGGYDLVQTESSGNFGNVIDNQTLTQLPIVGARGRNPLALVTLVPGVIVNGAESTGGGVNVNGSRDRAWNYVLDGVDVNESSSGGGNSSPAHLNPDMLAEFRVITSNFTPEYGRNSGGQVVMVTKSGTNSFHGNLFEFYQSPFLRANSPQAKAAGLPRTQFVQNIPGGSLGGPVFKDNTFFFVNVELLHARQTEVVTRSVYTDAAKAGQFRYVLNGRNEPVGSASASVDGSGNPIVPYATYNMVANDPQHIGLDPAVKAYLGLAPSPNTFGVGDGLNTAGYTFAAPSIDRQVDTTVKIDHIFSPRSAIYGRWYSGHQNTYGDAVNGGLQIFPGGPNTDNTFRQPRNFAFNWRFTPTANTTNEFLIGFNRFGYQFVNPAIAQTAATPFNFNLVAAPESSYLSNNRYLTTYQLVDNYTWVKGQHILKAGTNLRYGREIDHRGSIGSLDAIPQVTFDIADNPVDTAAFNTPGNINQTFDLPTLQNSVNDLLGRIGQIQAGYVSTSDSQAFKPAGSLLLMDHRWPEYDFYVQDSWRIRPNLVLDYGVRLDARLAPRFEHFPSLVPNQSVLFGENATSSLAFVPGKFYNDDWNNFGPSVGFAWDPHGNGRTSLRANYRIAFDRINPFSFSTSVFQGLPGLTYQDIDTTSGQNGVRAQGWTPPVPPTTPLALRQPPPYSVNSLTVADPNMRTPKTEMWALSLQQQIAPNTVFTLSYIGNHGIGLYGGYDSNQVNYRQNGFLSAFQTVQSGADSPLMTQIISTDTRRKPGESGTAFVKREYSSYLQLNNVAGLANVLATRLQGGTPLVVTDGLPANFFKPYSQYLGGLNVLSTRDYSNYNSLQAQVEKRFSNGLLFQTSYVWSKALDVRSYDPTFTTIATGATQAATGTPFDFHTPRLNYGPADFDRTNVFLANWVYDLPFGRGRQFGANWNRAVDAALGGWEVAGDADWESGRPVTFLSGSNTYGSSVETPASCNQCNPHMGHIHRDPGTGQQFFFTPQQISMLYTPAAGSFSNLGRNYFRQAQIWNVDATISKNFKTFRDQYLQARLEIQNVANNVTYDTFGSELITSTVFTRLNPATDGVINNGPRTMQLAAKYVF